MKSLFNRTKPLTIKLGKKAVAGIEFMKQLAIGIFVIVIIFFALAIAGANLKDATDDTVAQGLIDNFTGAISGFGSNVATWLVLGSLVVLISIIVIIILVVNRVSVGGEGNL